MNSIHHNKNKNILTHIWIDSALFDWAIIVWCINAVKWFQSWPVFVLAVFIVGVHQHRLAVLGHESAHGLISKNKKLNRLLANAFVFWPLCLNYDAYKSFHLKHHRYNGTSKDPELEHKAIFNQWKTRNIMVAALYSAIDLLGLSAPQIAVLQYTIHSKRKRWLAKAFILLSIHIALAMLILPIEISLVWYSAMVTSFWFCFRLRVWTEHVPERAGYTTKLKRPGALARWMVLPYNTWCHDVHHKRQSIPFYQLEDNIQHQYNNERITLTQLTKRLFLKRS